MASLILLLWNARASNQNIMKGFQLLVAKGVIPIINITDIPNLDVFDLEKKKIKMRARFDPTAYRLIYGFNEKDAVQRYLVNSKDPISEDKLEIIKLYDYENSEDITTYKYYLLHTARALLFSFYSLSPRGL